MAEEGLKTTPNKLIHIAKPIPFDIAQFMKQVEILAEASYTNSTRIKEIVSEIVLTYREPEKVTDKIEKQKIQKLRESKERKAEPISVAGGVN